MQRVGEYPPVVAAAANWVQWPLLRLGLATAAMVTALVWALPDSGAWEQWAALERALRMAGLVMVGLLAYASVHLVLGTRPRDFYAPKAP